jgi:hypothetical protein
MKAFLVRLRPEERVMQRILHDYVQAQRQRIKAQRHANSKPG